MVICLLAAIWGAVMISLLVAVVSNFFQLNKSQNEALLEIKTSRASAKSIKAAFRLMKAKKRYHTELERVDPNYQSNFLQGFRQRREKARKNSLAWTEQDGSRYATVDYDQEARNAGHNMPDGERQAYLAGLK